MHLHNITCNFISRHITLLSRTFAREHCYKLFRKSFAASILAFEEPSDINSLTTQYMSGFRRCSIEEILVGLPNQPTILGEFLTPNKCNASTKRIPNQLQELRYCWEVGMGNFYQDATGEGVFCWDPNTRSKHENLVVVTVARVVKVSSLRMFPFFLIIKKILAIAHFVEFMDLILWGSTISQFINHG